MNYRLLPKKIPAVLSLLLVGLLTFSCAKPPIYHFSGFNFTGKARKVTIPFKFINNLIIIPLKINDSDTLRFILDTGVKTALVTELDYSDSLNLKIAGKRVIRGLGEGENLEAYHSYGNKFILPRVLGQNQDLFVLTEDIFFLSSKLGTKVNGLIGFDVFKNFPIEIDYIAQRLTIHNPARRKKTKKFPGRVLPMTVETGKPYIRAEVEVRKGEKIPIKLVIDTGASHSLSLEPKPEIGITIPEKNIRAYLGRGLNGDVTGFKGRISTLRLAGYETNNLISSFPDSASMQGIYGVSGRNGSLGSNILRHYRVIFDYPNRKLYLSPNRHFNKKFYPNMSGMEISAPIPDLNHFVVSQITEGSPAALAGLEEGDEIISLFGRLTLRYSLVEISRIMQSRPGRKIVLRVRREDEILRITFVLKEPV